MDKLGGGEAGPFGKRLKGAAREEDQGARSQGFLAGQGEGIFKVRVFRARVEDDPLGLAGEDGLTVQGLGGGPQVQGHGMGGKIGGLWPFRMEGQPHEGTGPGPQKVQAVAGRLQPESGQVGGPLRIKGGAQ